MLTSLITTPQPLRISGLAFLSGDTSANIHLQLSCRGLGPLMTEALRDLVVRIVTGAALLQGGPLSL